MNYQSKYIKYKTKYMSLNNEQYGGMISIDFNNGTQIFKTVIEKSIKLKNAYETFWNNVNFNDAYVFYKNAIEYYKNNQNNKFHDFFSGIINKKLYTGSCQYLDSSQRNDFINKNDIKKIDIDDLCNLSVQIINILDTCFLHCPKLPFNIYAYRLETRQNNDDIIQLKKGTYYNNQGYMSTSINPWFPYNKDMDGHLQDNDVFVVMTILLPRDTMAYYMNHPFGIYHDKDINKFVGLEEHEIMLPRNNIFYVIETKSIGKFFFIKLSLQYQMIPKHHVISTDTEKTKMSILSKKQFNKIDKEKYIKHKTNVIDFEQNNIKIDILKSYNLINKNKNKTPVEYYKFAYNNIFPTDNSELLKWMIKQPNYDPKKYKHIKESEYDNVYKEFKNIMQYMKKTTKSYIIIGVHYRGRNNELYDMMTNEMKVNKIIKIKKPLLIEKSLSSSIFADTPVHIIKNNDTKILNSYTIDTNYPMMIIIKYRNEFEYIPLTSDYGVTFNIKQLKITNFEQKYITDDVYYYIVDAI